MEAQQSPKSNWFMCRKRVHLAFYCLVFATMVLLLMTLDGCGNDTSNSKTKKVEPIPVLVDTVIAKDIPVYISALGTVTPIESVTIKTQVNGQLMRLYFNEGQIVQQGDLLAEIDTRPYQAQLTQVKGQLLRDQALLANAKLDLQRYKTLFGQDSVSKQTLDTQIALVKQYQGNVDADQGQVEVAQINLDYCRIISPITGLVGLQQINPGNIVQTSDATGIVTINTIQPIYVVFAITEDDLPRVAQRVATGRPIQVEAYDRSQQQLLDTGTLFTMDNQISTATGTINVKGQFANDKKMLFPNQFVNIKILVDTLKNVTVVPTSAVQYGANGNFVYSLNEDQTVNIVPIKILGGTDEYTAIESQIKIGQQVVIQGADKLRQGTFVNVLKGT